jgi:Protein of unknown function (DUF3618)
MGQSPEELKDEIESTRANLGDTLEAIGDRVSPGRVIERRTARVRQGFAGLRDRVMGAAHDTVGSAKDRLGSTIDGVREAPAAGRHQTEGRPLVMGGLAFGVGVILAAVLPRTEAEAQAAPKLAQGVEPLKEELVQAGKDAMQQLSDPASDAVTEVKEAATAGVHQVADQARQSAEQTTGAGQDAVDQLRS